MNHSSSILGRHPVPFSPDAVSRTAGPWWVLVVLVTVIDGFRVPLLITRLRADVPADLVDRVGNDDLLDIALAVGAYSSLVVLPLIVGFCAVMAGFLEPRVFPHRRTIAGRQIGISVSTIGTVLLLSRVASVLPLAEPTRAGLAVVLALSAAAGFAWWLCPVPRRSAVWARGAGLGALLGIVLCLG